MVEQNTFFYVQQEKFVLFLEELSAELFPPNPD
jgi:hypothetical protein